MNNNEWAVNIFQRLEEIGLPSLLKNQTGWFHNMDVWFAENCKFIESLGVRLRHGLTKVCLIAEDRDEVIKVPFKPERGTRDFCTQEYRNYLLAEKEGLEQFFAPIRYVDMVNGVPVYLQEKEDVDPTVVSDSLRSYYENEYCEEYESGWTTLDEDETVIALLGESEEVYRLRNFILDNEINDLHSGNWGVNSCGDLVIIDYSGF